MGQISVTLSTAAGSVLSDIQHRQAQKTCGTDLFLCSPLHLLAQGPEHFLRIQENDVLFLRTARRWIGIKPQTPKRIVKHASPHRELG